MRKTLSCVIPLLIEFLVFTFISVCVHEFMHAMTMNIFGISAIIKPLTVWPEIGTPLDEWQLFMMYFSGGCFTAVLFGLLWIVYNWQTDRTDESLDESFIFGILCIFQLIWGITEGVRIWNEWLYNYSGFIWPTVAIIISWFMYYKRILAWILKLN